MSYQVLARKWRPRNFAELVGQEHVVRALVNAIGQGRIHHAFLFTGTRGVGKTTIARILAKALNCESGISAEPCGECSSCREVDAGRFIDLIEVDAASRTKVEETRELLENVSYTPARGRFKVYLIDEVHMFSGHSFNALLKTLEEPPPHVKFLFATTDPQKVPVTIRSRCLQFNLKRLPLGLIEGQLHQVLGKESIEFDAPALERIARAADGSMRDALSLLDQAIAFGDGRVGDEDTRSMLGDVGAEQAADLLEALADGDAGELLARLAKLAELVPDYAAILDELLRLLHRAAVVQVQADADDPEQPGHGRVAALADRLPAEDVQLWYQVALLGRRDLPLAPDPRRGCEMTLLRMHAFRPMAVAGGENLPPAGGDGAGRGDAPPTRVDGGKPGKTSTAGAAPPAVPARPVAAAGGAGPFPADDWSGIVANLDLGGLSRELAQHCSVAGWDKDGVLRLNLDAAGAQLRTTRTEAQLGSALETHLGRALTLRIESGADEAGETPARRRAREEEARQQAAERTIAEDPRVQQLRETFDAVVEPGSIAPR